jgi:hypothetical protein
VSGDQSSSKQFLRGMLSRRKVNLPRSPGTRPGPRRKKRPSSFKPLISGGRTEVSTRRSPR